MTNILTQEISPSFPLQWSQRSGRRQFEARSLPFCLKCCRFLWYFETISFKGQMINAPSLSLLIIASYVIDDWRKTEGCLYLFLLCGIYTSSGVCVTPSRCWFKCTNRQESLFFLESINPYKASFQSLLLTKFMTPTPHSSNCLLSELFCSNLMILFQKWFFAN